VEVGGDWYDVVLLPGGDVGVAIGDVAGHGLRAASIMGQLRMALRAYAVEETSPAGVLGRLHRLVRALALPEMATVIYLIFDLDTGVVTFANAGHPPPLLIGEDGARRYLEDSLAPPLGATPSASLFVDATAVIPPGSTLLLFTDGLIERRGVPLLHSLARLKDEVSTTGEDLDVLCDHILSSLVEGEVGDDIALVALRPVRFGDTPVHFRVPAEPRSLAPIRHTLRRWLRELDADRQEAYEILVASGEACANAVQHPYGLRDGFLEMDVGLVDGQVEIVVQDSGSWRSSSPPGGGHGLSLMRALMDTVEVTSGPEGTQVRMRRRIGSKVAGERAGAR
jgi:anti-sigma regulatory factor (Ser/Thr protein kinase)